MTHGVPAGGDDEPGELFREQQDTLDLGSAYGVGYSGEDADDVSPPEMHLGEVPVRERSRLAHLLEALGHPKRALPWVGHDDSLL